MVVAPRRFPVALAVRVVALGLAAGGRATLGVGAPVLAHGPRIAQVVAGAAVAGELVGDKLPMTPDRTEPLGLTGRAVSGAIGAVLLAKRSGAAPVAAGLLGGTAALAGSFLGLGWRRRARGHLPDLAAALVEDAAVLALAWRAVRG